MTAFHSDFQEESRFLWYVVYYVPYSDQSRRPFHLRPKRQHPDFGQSRDALFALGSKGHQQPIRIRSRGYVPNNPGVGSSVQAHRKHLSLRNFPKPANFGGAAASARTRPMCTSHPRNSPRHIISKHVTATHLHGRLRAGRDIGGRGRIDWCPRP